MFRLGWGCVSRGGVSRGYGLPAIGTHPTGMHSCTICSSKLRGQSCKIGHKDISKGLP